MKNIEDLILEETRNLSDAYYPFYMENKNPGAMKEFTTTNHNYWKNKVFFAYKKWFEKAARMFAVREGYDAKSLIQSFLSDGFKYPQQLSQEYVWKKYVKNGAPITMDLEQQNKEEIITALTYGIKELSTYKTVENWINAGINKRLILNNLIRYSPVFFAFSSSFINFCIINRCDYYYDFTELRMKVIKLLEWEKIEEILKKNLKEDYYEYQSKVDTELDKLQKQGIVW